MGAGSLEGTLKAELALSAFSGIKLGWEPVLEPWHFRRVLLPLLQLPLLQLPMLLQEPCPYFCSQRRGF